MMVAGERDELGANLPWTRDFALSLYFYSRMGITRKKQVNNPVINPETDLG